MKAITTLLFSLILTLSYSQNTVANRINFETNSFEILNTEQEKIKAWINSYSIINIQLNGYTDNVGSEKANLQLSKNRVETVFKYLKELGFSEAIINLNYYGEINEEASENIEFEKLENRRVDIIITYEIPKLVDQHELNIKEVEIVEIEEKNEDTVSAKINNTELFSLLKRNEKVQKFKISVNQDTVIKTDDGLIFYFNKFSFKTDCSDSVEINIVEYNSKSSIVLGNMQTVSNNKQLYSVGMYDLRAFCNQKEIKELKNNYTVLVPINKDSEPIKNVKGFYGYRDSITNQVNWIQDPYKTIKPYNGGLLCGGVRIPNAKICFLRRWFRSKKVKLSKQKEKQIDAERKRIKRKYKNVDFEKMGDIPDKDLNYYVFQPRRMGKVNCDIFWNEKESNMITQKVILDTIYSKNVEIKMVFKRRRSVISSTNQANQSFEFNRIPKNENAYLLGLVLTDQKEIKLGIKKIKTNSDDIALSFETIGSMKELEEKLKKINE